MSAKRWVSGLVPWWLKIALKVVLARVPVPYQAISRLGIFRHGRMDVSTYAQRVFSKHFAQAQAARGGLPAGFTGLELGPGDSLYSGIYARAAGAGTCFLVDAGAYAHTDAAAYRRLAGQVLDEEIDGDSVAEIAATLGTVYLTHGLESLRDLESDSVDFAWSQAVLEHVRRGEFAATLTELRRVLRTDGVASHRIDMKDHLGGGLNNLRLASAWWEREWMATSGFYTNRLRYSEIIAAAEEAGFHVEVIDTDRWERAPLARAALATEFADLSDEDLQISAVDLLLRPAQSPKLEA